MRIPTALALLVFALTAAAAPPRDPGALVAEADRLQRSDPAAALRLIDEVLRLPAATPDHRATVLQEKCWISTDAAVALAAANAGLAEAARAKDPKLYGQLLSCRGNALENASRPDEAARDYLAANQYAVRIKDRKLEADTLLQVGFLRYYRGDLNAALIDFQKAYELHTARKDATNRRAALGSIAHIYADSKVGQYDKAIEYYQQILPEYRADGNQTGVADTLFNIGSTYDRKGDLASAMSWYQQALAMEKLIGRDDEAAYVKRSIGITLTKLGRPQEGLRLFNEALQTFIKSRDDDRAAHVRQSRGIAYRKLGRLDDAIADLESSGRYFEKTKNTRFLEKGEDELALAYAASGRWREAFEARSAHALLQRDLAEKLREEHTSRLRVQFDAEKKEHENRALIRENALRQKAGKLQDIVLILGAAVIVVLTLLVIRHFRDARRMRIMALTDELTRLPNRRHLLAVAEEELHKTRGGGEPFSLVAFDIDFFKRINDTWGHAAGDVVLQRVAHACRTVLRPTDRIGRTGGEEFTVVLPATRMADAVAVAERLRGAVEAIDCSDVDSSLRVTISLGVAEWNPSDTTLTRITGRADEVLYRAKELGRNRVELAVA
jgi:diguanylate cyclase (GGDEF)-like protein